MSKKPDFTQKLLDDLRLRKQRLAAAQKPSDARENLRRPYQGTGDANIPKTNGHRSTHGRHRSLATEDASKAIVPIQTTRSSEYISDLSMALAFALENGGRLGNIEFLGNPMIRKASLHHAQRRSVDFGEMSGRYTSESHQLVTGRSTISQLHIREISKGAQKLNQILKACAHGLNFDRYSIEVGKELLKGAVDLEESLRMLVNLQEASQYMVSPKGKQRIRLLEGEEDDEATVEVKGGRRFPEKPRFSFDGSSRNSIEDAKEVTKTGLKQKLLTLPYHSSSKSHQPDTDKHALIIANSAYHRRSMSFDPDSEVISTFSGATKNFRSNKPPNQKAPENSSTPSNSKNGNKIKQSNSHGPEQEKGRIPNVIAKLMGLEEIPLKADLKNRGAEKIPDSRQGTKRDENLKQKAQRSLKEVDSMVTTSEKPVSQITRQVKELQANKIAATWNTTIMTVVNEGKQNRKEAKNMENTNPLPMNSERPTFEINLQINATCLDRIKETQIAKQEVKGRGDNTKPKDQKSTGIGNHTQPVFTFALQEKHMKYREAADSELEGANKRLLQKEHKGPTDRISMSDYRQETIYDSQPKQTSGNQKSESNKAKQDGAGEKSAKIKSQVKDARRTDMMLKNPLKPIPKVNPQKKMLQRNQNPVAGKKSSTETPNATQPKENGSSTYFESNMKKSANGSLEEQRLVAQKTDAERIAALILPVETNKAVHPPSVHMVDTEKAEAQESKKHGKTKDAKNRMAGSPQATAQRIKQKTSVLQELKHRRHEGIPKVKETIISIQPLKLEQHLQQKDAPASIPCDHVGDDCRTPKETEKNIAANSNRYYINSKSPAVLPFPEISLGGDQALKSDFKAIQSRVAGIDNGSVIGNSNSLREQLQPNTKPEIRGSLTKHENHLKQILVKSQHFLNTAEALFRLHIPFDIFHASRNKCEDKENKLVLDCAYEIMKRKGDREELGFHSSVGMPVVSVKVKCLDDLVKQLHEDLEHLEFRGETGGDNYDAAATCLHETLKGDIGNRKPDVNCMWDFGWSEMMFAYLEKDEVIKDVEKHVLNRLIDEITGDLVHVSNEKSYYKAAN